MSNIIIIIVAYGIDYHYSLTICISTSIYIYVLDSIQVKKQNVSLAMLKELKERCPNITELELIKMNLPHISGDDLPRSLQCLKITHSFLAPGWLIGNTKSNVLPNIRYLDLTG